MAGVLRPALSTAGWTGGSVIHDFLLPDGRQLLFDFSREFGFESLRQDVAAALGPSTYFYAFFSLPGRRLMLMGHPPQDRVVEALTMEGLPQKLLMAQEDIHGPGTRYQLWDFSGSVVDYPLNTGLGQALRAAGWPSASGKSGP